MILNRQEKFIILVVSIVLIVGTATILLNTKSSTSRTTSDVQESPVYKSVGTGIIIGRRGSVYIYDLVGKLFQSISLPGGYPGVYSMYGQSVFFIARDGLLHELNLRTSQQHIVTLPQKKDGATTSAGRIADFLITDGRIVYLDGPCAAGGPCALYVYNQISSTSDLVMNQFPTDEISRIELRLYDGRSLIQLILLSGDGCGAKATLYEINVTTHEKRELDTASAGWCDESPPPPSALAAQEKYNRLIKSPRDSVVQTVICGTTRVESRSAREITLMTNNIENTIPEAQFIGCLE